MLSAADVDIVRRDPAIPGLAVVLDPELFLGAMRRRYPDIGLLSTQVNYLKYRPHRYCRVGYQLQLCSGALDGYATAYTPGAREFTTVLDDVGTQFATTPGRFLLSEHTVVVSVFPMDSALPALSRLDDVNQTQQCLRELCPSRPDLWSGNLETIRYRPERRYVGRLRGSNDCGGVVKWYSQREYPTARANVQSFQSTGNFQCPRTFGVSDHDWVIATEWLRGRMLEDVLTTPENDFASVRLVAQGLADLHKIDVPQTLTRILERAGAAIYAASLGVGFVLPHLRDRTECLRRRIRDSLGSQPVRERPIHGDFSPRQVVLSTDGAGFVDFDDAGIGDPAMDLGFFLASLERLVLLGGMTTDRMAAVATEFLDAYERASSVRIPYSLAYYVACGMFRKALHPFRQRASDWPRQIEAIIERVDALVRQEVYEPAT